MAFGAEFCSRRIPTLKEVVEVLDLCRGSGLGFSLVTPVLREGAFDETAAWLESVALRKPGAEWVASDWGLLLWAKEKGLPLLPVAGRLLGRQRRGPRALSMLFVSSPPEAAALKGSAWDDPVASSLLTEFGVARVELDLLLQGVRRPALPPGVSLSLCGPWIPVTLSPSCSWSADPLGCPHVCRRHATAVQKTEEDPHELWSRGNALFVRSEPGRTSSLAVSLGADRLVWAEAIPG